MSRGLLLAVGRAGRASIGPASAAAFSPAQRSRAQSLTNSHRISKPTTAVSTMREIVHLQAGQCGNQIGAKVGGRGGGDLN